MLRSLGIAGLFGVQPARSEASDSRLSENGLRAPKTVHDLFDRYDRRFAEAMLHLPERAPARPDDRTAIVGEVKRCLGIRDERIPTISADTVRLADFDGGRIEFLRSRSWPGVQAAALLYRPESPPDGPLPLVILCCGHGAGGKLSAGYQRMARHIARRGALVLCPDNIGQGERVAMGHRESVVPFACGLSVQGLIVMETMGWVAWALKHPQVDPQRLAAIGNSGGGTLTLFLAALCPELAVLSSSGYPSTFEFVARKEKRHCHCNILPGVVGNLEIWHLLGCFAPRPMFIFQGRTDSLFPEDLFHHTARKVRDVYEQLGHADALRARVFNGEHSWDLPRTKALGDFLAGQFGLAAALPDGEEERLLSDSDRCFTTWPGDALTMDELAQKLTGKSVEGQPNLWDVFPPRNVGDIPLEDVTSRGSTRQIFAQFEAFLTRPSVPSPRQTLSR